jgi:ribosomal protein L7Ae-like RNA K-turn-binding protein
MERGNVKFLLIATDLAENTTKKCTSTAVSQEIPFRFYGTKESLSTMTGEPNRGIFGITDVQLAKVIMEEIDKEQETETGKNKE